MGTAKCCQVPMKSMNFRSTISMFLLLAKPRTSFAFIAIPPGAECWNEDAAAIRSDGVVTAFAGADPDDFLDVGDEDLPVADPSRPGRLLDELDHLGDQVVGHDDLDLDLGQEIDDVFRPPVQLGVPLLAAESLDLGNRHP